MNKAKRLKRAKRKSQAVIYRKAYKMENPKKDTIGNLFAGLRSSRKDVSKLGNIKKDPEGSLFGKLKSLRRDKKK